MANPHDWFDYVGACGSVVAVVISIAAYRKTEQLKKLDLRMQLRVADGSLRHRAAALPDLLARSRKSKQASMAADGLLRSSQWNGWDDSHARDLEELDKLLALQPAARKNYVGLGQRELETALEATHAVSIRVEDLAEKYERSLKEDADAVSRRKQNAEQRAIAQLGRQP